MKQIIFTFGLMIVLGGANAQDFRNAQWGDSPETVQKKERLPVLNQYISHKMLHLTFVEFTGEELYYTYTYMFYNNQLVGIKTKTAFLTGDNSRYVAERLYKQTYETYKEKYENLKEENNSGQNKFNVVLKDTKIYVEIKGEDNEYFLLESIMKSKRG